MPRLIVLACVLTLFSCKKDTHIPAYIIPSSIIDLYASFNLCDSDCAAEIWLVSYNHDEYYGSKLSGVVCPDINITEFYFTDGSKVESSDLFNKLIHEGRYERVLWQCTKQPPCPNTYRVAFAVIFIQESLRRLLFRVSQSRLHWASGYLYFSVLHLVPSENFI